MSETWYNVSKKLSQSEYNGYRKYCYTDVFIIALLIN